MVWTSQAQAAGKFKPAGELQVTTALPCTCTGLWSVPFLDLPCHFHYLSTTFSLTFHCLCTALSLTFHCLFTAFL